MIGSATPATMAAIPSRIHSCDRLAAGSATVSASRSLANRWARSAAWAGAAAAARWTSGWV